MEITGEAAPRSPVCCGNDQRIRNEVSASFAISVARLTAWRNPFLRLPKLSDGEFSLKTHFSDALTLRLLAASNLAGLRQKARLDGGIAIGGHFMIQRSRHA